MTVCIAVACDYHPKQINNHPQLIMVSDTLLSMGITSADTLKARALTSNWSVMLAGEDVTYAEDVIEQARKNIKSRGVSSQIDAVWSMVNAYKSIRIEQIEQRYLSSYNITVAEFLAKNPDFPTPTKRQSLLDDIDKFDLGCEFLVSGFPPTGSNPCIFQITNPGRYVPQSLQGYWAIGSGDANAITYLARRNQSDLRPFASSLYNAIAAKKLAEKAQGIGPDTIVYIMKHGGTQVEFLTTSQVDAIIKMWNEEEANVQPANLEDRVKKIMTPPSNPELPMQLASGTSEPVQ